MVGAVAPVVRGADTAPTLAAATTPGPTVTGLPFCAAGGAALVTGAEGLVAEPLAVCLAATAAGTAFDGPAAGAGAATGRATAGRGAAGAAWVLMALLTAAGFAGAALCGVSAGLAPAEAGATTLGDPGVRDCSAGLAETAAGTIAADVAAGGLAAVEAVAEGTCAGPGTGPDAIEAAVPAGGAAWAFAAGALGATGCAAAAGEAGLTGARRLRGLCGDAAAQEIAAAQLAAMMIRFMLRSLDAAACRGDDRTDGHDDHFPLLPCGAASAQCPQALVQRRGGIQPSVDLAEACKDKRLSTIEPGLLLELAARHLRQLD